MGEVEVPNPGIDAMLAVRSLSKTTIAFNLVLTQRPGVWSQVLTWKPVRYDRVVLPARRFKKAEVYCEDKRIAGVKVENVH